MIRYIFLLFLFFFTSCAKQYPAVQARDSIVFNYAKDTFATRNWSLRGYGGSFNENIKTVYLNFGVNEEVNVKEARRLIVHGVEEFLRKANETQSLRPFLIHYPLSNCDLHYALSFIDHKGQHIPRDFVCYASLLNGMIEYCIKSEKDSQLIPILEEPYTEALKIVEQETSHLNPPHIDKKD